MDDYLEQELEALAHLAEMERMRREQEAEQQRQVLEDIIKSQPNGLAD